MKNYFDHTNKTLKQICFVFLFLYSSSTFSQLEKKSFTLIPLGVYGGLDESNLSAYMLAPIHSYHYVCLDAGSLHDGIQKAIQQKNISGNVDEVLKNNIKAYLISHPHLDHVAGLIINSPDDSNKNIYALPFCIQILEDKYFTWESWANFADEGEKPLLKKYHYVNLSRDSETAIVNTKMFVRPFELSHSNPNKSTAFLVRFDSSYILYLGDTGADSIEKSTKLNVLWHYITPIIQQKKLKAILIETSFPDEQPANKLFGHLTPFLLYDEMQKLSLLCGASNLKKVPLIITHIKPSANNEELIKKELSLENKLHLALIFPHQGEKINL